jgi:hypothetical protein
MIQSSTTAFDLILLKINFGGNTMIYVWDYDDLETNYALSSPNFFNATITTPIRVRTPSFA